MLGAALQAVAECHAFPVAVKARPCCMRPDWKHSHAGAGVLLIRAAVVV